MSHRKLFESSKLSLFYASTRPKPPPELINQVVSSCKSTKLAVDVGCGTGQVTSLLSPFFTRVIGVDSSHSQISEASKSNKCDNVEYRVENSEKLTMSTGSVDLITCSQALHWLDIPKSLEEFKRALTDGGIFAAITYLMPLLRSTKGFCVDENFVREKVYKHHLLKDHWNWKERSYIDSCYNNIDFSPFRNVERQIMVYRTVIPLKKQTDYIDTHLHSWSPFQKLVEKDEAKAKELLDELHKMIPAEDQADRGLILEYPYTLILARK